MKRFKLPLWSWLLLLLIASVAVFFLLVKEPLDQLARSNFNSSPSTQQEQPKHVAYPKDGVRGIYLSPEVMGTPADFNRNIDLIKKTNLNAVVVDVKTDGGRISGNFEGLNKDQKAAVNQMYDLKKALKTFSDQNIYSIARITTFKDSFAAERHPDWSFKTSSGEIWSDASGEHFLNPFDKRTWPYIVGIGKAAAKAGFSEIQFDYVRFSDSFEPASASLTYSMGDYEGESKTDNLPRQKAIADFLSYAVKELSPYNVKVSADIFGYVPVMKSTSIGQNYDMIAKVVNATSGMPYPSHWGSEAFGVTNPDLHPYEVINGYIQVEKNDLKALGEKAKAHPRPWLQAFTASYLPNGTWMTYGPNAISAQIKALKDNKINEYLLWGPLGHYPEDANY